jgi:hypothetical protein
MTAPSSTVAWLAITMVDDGGWTTIINATAKSNGPRHPTSTPAKPASTTTTTSNACSTAATKADP